MKNKGLLQLKNLGPATLKDLEILGIATKEQLAQADPVEMYERLQKLTGVKHDICVLDVFQAIVHQVKTDQALHWWYFSRIRKSKK